MVDVRELRRVREQGGSCWLVIGGVGPAVGVSEAQVADAFGAVRVEVPEGCEHKALIFAKFASPEQTLAALNAAPTLRIGGRVPRAHFAAPRVRSRLSASLVGPTESVAPSRCS